MKSALTIAGSDPSGGAGIQADIRVFHQFGVHGLSVVTLLTSQNSRGCDAVELLSHQVVSDQLDSLLSDSFSIGAIKTGALGDAQIVSAIAKRLGDTTVPLVIDPVLAASDRSILLDSPGSLALQQELLPRCYLITPNIFEAEYFAGERITTPGDIRDAAETIAARGAKNVLITGGHREDAPIDLLFSEGKFHEFPGDRVVTNHTHGTGCVFSAAITAQLAQQIPLTTAIERAKKFVTQALRTAPGLGHGRGPMNLLSVPEPRG